MPEYGSAAYWDERYATVVESYDWYQDFNILKEYIMPYLQDKGYEILIPGCGNSTLGADLYQIGYQNITNIDISEVVVNQMAGKYQDLEEMEFNAMDARHLGDIPDECFDIIIDKGLFDAQLCSEDRLSSADELLKEMLRVLKPGGYYLIISHGPPATRLNHIGDRPGFMVEKTTPIPRPTHPKMVLDKSDKNKSKNHFLYSCRRK